MKNMYVIRFRAGLSAIYKSWNMLKLNILSDLCNSAKYNEIDVNR